MRELYVCDNGPTCWPVSRAAAGFCEQVVVMMFELTGSV